MNETVVKNQELIIISPVVTNATYCIVTDIFDDQSFQVKLSSKENFSAGDAVDLFATAGSGVLFFSSSLINSDNNTLIVSKPKNVTVIQRREYTRVEINKNILIDNEDKKIRATIVDISAGGMRLLSESEMSQNKDYQVNFSLESNLSISCKFRPVRISFLNDEKKYSIPGKFKLIKNIDRVALMQYCMKKQSELLNK